MPIPESGLFAMIVQITCARISADPPAAYNKIVLVEDDRLSRSNRPLRLIERNDNSIAIHPNLCIRRLVPMANLGLHTNRSIERLEGDPIHPMRMQGSRAQIVITADNNLPLISAQLDHIQR